MIRSARDASGAVLVFVALSLPVMIGVGGLVVDVGNWFAHKRHLQVQADAGALAAAGKFRIPCAPAPILDEAAKYSSVEYSGPVPGPGYNPQIGATPAGQLHRMINSKTFYNQSSPVDDTVVEGDPCTSKMIDVKLTETDLPWFLKIARVPFIDAQARVEIKKKISSKGSLPIGVPEPGPQKAKALFVDETTGTLIASTDLIQAGTANGLAIWSNSGAPAPPPVAVTVDTAKIGVRIVLSGSSSTNCGDPLVDCYGAGTSTQIVANTPGLVRIRGWSSTPAGTATAPQVRNVNLVAGTCEDAYFTAIVGTPPTPTDPPNPCTVNVRATIDGLLPTETVFAQRATGANTKVPLTYSNGIWASSAGIPITAGEGSVAVNLFFGSGKGTQIGSGSVQRTYAGNESLTASGPIKLLRLSEGGVPGANSFQTCTTNPCTPHNLVVTLGLKPTLQNAQSVGDPIVTLKVAGGGSQNQALDCDPAQSNLRDQLANGCAPAYTTNDGQATCPVKNTLWGSAQPWNCVVIATGGKVGQIGPGLDERILGAGASTCTAPNNWKSFPNIPAGDPRVVNVFLTPFGAFTGSGGTTVPVTGFATFYVTGWDNGGCQGANAPAGKPDDPAGQGAVVGHFIKYIDTLNDGGATEDPCDFNSLGLCVAVMTR